MRKLVLVWQFRGIELDSSPEVMEPRSDVLVELALREPIGARIHDLGTGSGALVIALALERPDLRLSASDNSSAAVELARRNCARHRLDLPVWQQRGLPEEPVDLVIANLPYLSGDEAEKLGEATADWAVAGDDPLAVIKGVLATADPGQRIALQHPLRRAEEIAALLIRPQLQFAERNPCATIGYTGE